MTVILHLFCPHQGVPHRCFSSANDILFSRISPYLLFFFEYPRNTSYVLVLLCISQFRLLELFSKNQYKEGWFTTSVEEFGKTTFKNRFFWSYSDCSLAFSPYITLATLLLKKVSSSLVDFLDSNSFSRL